MDFDRRFKRSEFRKHLEQMGLVLSDNEFDDPLTRTTKKTRRGHEFSFRPAAVQIGWMSAENALHEGFSCSRFSNLEPNPGVPRQNLATSFWFRFHRSEQYIYFRLFCLGYEDVRGLWPYEGRIHMRDTVPSRVELRARPLDGDADKMNVTLTITTRQPPELQIRLPNPIPGKEVTYERTATESDFRHDSLETTERAAGVVSLFGDPHSALHPALWLTYRFSFEISRRQYKLLWMCMVRLRKLGLRPDFATPELPVHPVALAANLATFHNQWSHLPFTIQYALEMLVSHNIALYDVQNLLKRLNSSTSHEKDVHGLEALFATKGHTLNDRLQALGSRFETFKRISVPTHCTYIHRCLVTPLAILLLPPQIETTNSVIRNFEQWQDRFLRVHFVEQQGEMSMKASLLLTDDMYDGEQGQFARIRRALRYGMRVANRHYTFLAYGESQIKEQGAWFIAELPEVGFTRQAILTSMGELAQERIIAKFAARQGLAFSTSRPLKEAIFLEKIDDKTSGNYIFTDGCGQCSDDVLHLACQALGISAFAGVSAVQVRVDGGGKGVIAKAPPWAANNERTIRLRPSMIKLPLPQDAFGRSRRCLNVMKASQYSPAYLNRQAILLLEALGIDDKVLLSLFLEAKARIESFSAATAHPSTDPYSGDLSNFPLQEAATLGLRDDPLMENITRLIKCKQLQDLKWKARFCVKDGTYLMGVPDETGSLAQEEVYCCIFDDYTKQRTVITGDCIVFRNPCLHPGDIRRVVARDVPELSYLTNVVVFNTKGNRDLPNQLAGGDLDGDYYTLIWDKSLIIPSNALPDDYVISSTGNRKLYGPITSQDIQEFYVQFLMHNNLGVIDNAHLAVSDYQPQGPRSSSAVELARAHNKAVDFFKTGVSIDRKTLPQVSQWPDFMGKTGKDVKSYESSKVLGLMFRAITPEPIFEPMEPRRPQCLALLDHVEVPTHLLEQASHLKEAYDREVLLLLSRYEITSEVEGITGMTLKPSRRRMRRQRDHDRESAVRESFDHIRKAYLMESERILADSAHMEDMLPGNSSFTTNRLWAVACYRIAMGQLPDEAVLQESDMSGSNTDFGELADDMDENQEIPDEESPDNQDTPFVQDSAQSALYSFGWLYMKEILLMIKGRT